jgi:hypothetical protein
VNVQLIMGVAVNMSRFFFAKTKRELIECLATKYPHDVKRFKKMPLKQLRAIRINVLKEFEKRG